MRSDCSQVVQAICFLLAFPIPDIQHGFKRFGNCVVIVLQLYHNVIGDSEEVHQSIVCDIVISSSSRLPTIMSQARRLCLRWRTPTVSTSKSNESFLVICLPSNASHPRFAIPKTIQALLCQDQVLPSDLMCIESLVLFLFVHCHCVSRAAYNVESRVLPSGSDSGFCYKFESFAWKLV